MKDYYKILGVKRTATTREIKSAYRDLVKRHHPDKTGRCEEDEQIKEINEAYHTLIDPQKRKTYNENLGETIKVNVVGYDKSGKKSMKSTWRGRPEPLIPRKEIGAGNFDSILEEELRYFERLRRYLLRRFFDDDFFF
ncbi:J domain-containing protein [Caldithrix abyssi]